MKLKHGYLLASCLMAVFVKYIMGDDVLHMSIYAFTAYLLGRDLDKKE